jgi:hypothetical protein
MHVLRLFLFAIFFPLVIFGSAGDKFPGHVTREYRGRIQPCPD